MADIGFIYNTSLTSKIAQLVLQNFLISAI